MRARPHLAVLALVLALPGVASAAPRDAIRTGGPSAPSDVKVAIVVSAKSLAGRSFTITRGSRVMLRGRLRAVRGSAAPWRHAAKADLSALRTPGAYVVRVGALHAARSWLVQSGARSAAVRRLLRTYAVQADGNEPNPVFAPSHLKDAIVKGGPLDGRRVDLTGGWRDAGDNLKFTRTTAAAVAYMHLAARLDPADAARLRATAQVGVRWLLKAHPAPGVFIELVGDERDHDGGFRDPARDDADRRQGIGVRYAYPTVSSDVLATAAAALALAAADAGADRDRLLAAAGEWYAQARATNASARASGPNLGDFYPDDFFYDDLAFAASSLWRATGEQHYLDETADFLRRGPEDELFGGITVSTPRPLVGADLCGGLGRPAADDAAIRELGCGDVRKTMEAIRERVDTFAFGSPGIFTFGWAADNGAAGALAAAARRAGVAADGATIAAGARDFLRGRNQWGSSFIVGRAGFEAHNPHHSAYLKGNAARLLDGAVVGGPARPKDISNEGLKLLRGSLQRPFNSSALAYEDSRADYVTSEVSLGTASASLLLAASLG